MGFSNPSKVRVYGYGGAMGADRLALSSYVDDLPPVQTLTAKNGNIYFYAQGPDTWKINSSGHGSKSFNLYTTTGTYFITQVADNDSIESPEIVTIGFPEAESPATTVKNRLHHEQNLISPGEAGAMLVGEDFRYTPKRTFNFNLPGRVEGTRVGLELSFVAKTYTRMSSVLINVNGKDLPGGLSVGSTVNESYYHGAEAQGYFSFDMDGEKLAVALTHKSTVTVNGAWLNFMSINYTRHLRMPSSGALPFWTNEYALKLASDKELPDLEVWDVTSPTNVERLNISKYTNGGYVWRTPYNGTRSYVAFRTDNSIPEPTVEGVVANQNLHGIEQADMVIVTLPAWRSQAERLAQLHRMESQGALTVAVADAQQVYNEFGSGEPDVAALRRFFKMLYDRGAAAGRPLQFALLMGRTTYDNTASTDAFKSLGIKTLPTWYSNTPQSSLNDKVGFGCDDILAMLADNSGYNMSADKIDIALGRMPVRTLAEATSAVDKIYDYVNRSKRTPWKNQVMILADDQDNGVHMTQAESVSRILNPEESPNFVINKVYMDAFTRQGASYPDARNAMFRLLNEGTMLWIYLGHANNHTWTHDGQLTFNDINSLYLKHLPALFAGTCDFLRWDSNTLSGGEIFFHERNGGTISMISATRPVYITDNGMFADALARALAKRADDGSMMSYGEYYRQAKNDLRDSKGNPVSNSNRLRYVFMGDPALRLTMPQNYVRIDSINSVDVSAQALAQGGEQAIIQALGRPVFAGAVTDAQGNVLKTFNGIVYVDIYDAEYSTTSNGYGSEGAKVSFQQHGSKLYSGVLPVKDGYFSGAIAMPAEITDNFTPAFLSMYAVEDNNATEAVGVSNAFYVYGQDTQAATDTIPPTIDKIYLNHESFTNGAIVNLTPTLVAEVSDNVGINISSAGVGHQMTMVIDEKKSISDVALYYQPSADGSPSGKIVYPIETLTEGAHTLTLRVWDTTGNSASSTIDFNVSGNATAKIYNIYTDSNPASTQANFYITSDRPEQMVTVNVTVYNLLGHPLWNRTVTGINDMFTSTPVVWDLTDSAGRRVPRGIYLYRATITDNGETFDTGSQRIAVTAY